MKITNVRTVIAGNPWKNWLFALVETDEGLTGVGEGTANYFTRTVEAAIHELRPMYIDQDPFQPALIVQRMTRDVYTDGGQIHRCAVAAIHVALPLRKAAMKASRSPEVISHSLSKLATTCCMNCPSNAAAAPMSPR